VCKATDGKKSLNLHCDLILANIDIQQQQQILFSIKYIHIHNWQNIKHTEINK
jgi:hypothetical protein